MTDFDKAVLMLGAMSLIAAGIVGGVVLLHKRRPVFAHLAVISGWAAASLLMRWFA